MTHEHVSEERPTRQVEISHQAALYNDWVQGTGKKLGDVLGADAFVIMLSTFGLERCTPLDQLFDSTGKPPADKPAAADPYAEFFE